MIVNQSREIHHYPNRSFRKKKNQANNTKHFLKLMFINIQSIEHKSSLTLDEKALIEALCYDISVHQA